SIALPETRPRTTIHADKPLRLRCGRARRIAAVKCPWRVATLATTRPPDTARPESRLGHPHKRVAMRQRLDASIRPCSNLQLPWTAHRAESPNPRHSKPSSALRRSEKTAG